VSIKFDVASSVAAETTSITLAHTVSASIPRPILVVLIGARAPTGGDLVTNVTYNGVAMTRAVAYTGTSQENSFIYYMLNPPTGAAYNIVVTRTGAFASVVIGLSYGGVDKIGASFANGSSVGTALVQATVVNSFHKSTVVVIPILRGKTETLTFDANVTQRVGVLGSGAPANQGCLAGAGEWSNGVAGVSTTAGGTFSSSTVWAVAALELVEMRTRLAT
jgi:hypothetical protein